MSLPFQIVLDLEKQTKEDSDAITAFIAGMRARQLFNEGASYVPTPPAQIDAPGVSVSFLGIATITAPNFIYEDGVCYQLQYSDNDIDWMTFTSNIGPNDSVTFSYAQNRCFRVLAVGDVQNMPGIKSNPIP